jgi:hypothetical protein
MDLIKSLATGSRKNMGSLDSIFNLAAVQINCCKLVKSFVITTNFISAFDVRLMKSFHNSFLADASNTDDFNARCMRGLKAGLNVVMRFVVRKGMP